MKILNYIKINISSVSNSSITVYVELYYVFVVFSIVCVFVRSHKLFVKLLRLSKTYICIPFLLLLQNALCVNSCAPYTIANSQELITCPNIKYID